MPTLGALVLLVWSRETHSACENYSAAISKTLPLNLRRITM